MSVQHRRRNGRQGRPASRIGGAVPHRGRARRGQATRDARDVGRRRARRAAARQPHLRRAHFAVGGLAHPTVEGRRVIRQASHDFLQFWHAFNQLRVLEANTRAASARRAMRSARCSPRAEAPRVAMWAQLAESLRRSHAVDESAPCWYVACGAPVASAGAAMSKLRDGEVFAAHGTGPGCAAADAAWGQRLAEADHFVSHYELGLDERGQTPAGTSVAFAYCDPRAPGFAQELESMLFRGAPARHTLAVALRYRPASRRPTSRCTSRALARSWRSRVASTARTTRAPSAATATTTPTRRRPTTTTRRSRRGSSANAPVSR